MTARSPWSPPGRRKRPCPNRRAGRRQRRPRVGRARPGPRTGPRRRVNAVSPGAIETTWWDALPEDQRRTTLATFGQRAPADRNDTPDDVADAIAALIENCFLTEVVLLCDDGPWLT